MTITTALLMGKSVDLMFAITLQKRAHTMAARLPCYPAVDAERGLVSGVLSESTRGDSKSNLSQAEYEPPPMNPLMPEGIGKGEDGRGVAGVREVMGLDRKMKKEGSLRDSCSVPSFPLFERYGGQITMETSVLIEHLSEHPDRAIIASLSGAYLK